MNNVKNYLIILLVLLLLTGWGYSVCYLLRQAKESAKKQDQNYTAILGEFKKSASDKDTVFIGKAVEGTPSDITGTEMFGTLPPETKKQIEDLAEIKRLLAAMETRLSIVTTRIDRLSYDITKMSVGRDSVTIPKGTTISFVDSVGNYQFREYITFSDSIVRDFRSVLKPKPSFTFTRNKDKSIDAVMSFGDIEDSYMTIEQPIAFYIPSDVKQRKHPKAYKITMETLKWTARIGVPSLAFYGGLKLGVNIGASLE